MGVGNQPAPIGAYNGLHIKRKGALAMNGADSRDQVAILGKQGKMNSNSSQRASLGNDEANHAGSFVFKPFLSLDNQIEHLRDQGFSIDDEGDAKERLSSINYYRLRGYWMSLECDGAIPAGTPLDLVFQTYSLDADLRLWVWNAIADIELKMRSQFAYHFAKQCGPAAFLDPRYFKSRESHRRSIDSYTRERNRAQKDKMPCVIHNLEKYGELPLWAAVEVMSMGTISSLYGNLINDQHACLGSTATVSAVAKAFGFRASIVKSWLQHLTTVRNICAHHGRFYNRVMRIRPKMLRRDAEWASSKEFPTFLIIKRLYESSWPERWDAMASNLGRIIDSYPDVSLVPMGFPDCWREVLCVPDSTGDGAVA